MSDVPRLVGSQKENFNRGGTRPQAFRRAQLQLLDGLVTRNEKEICAALFADLRKPKTEALISEFAVVKEEIRLAIKNLPQWMAPRRAPTPLALWPSRSRTYFEPLGVSLIIGPWNYPFQLVMAPLVGAMAAGCCAILKPSEVSGHTSRLISDMITRTFPSDYLGVVEGAANETQELLAESFDHIFFTGSTAVGREVLKAAAPRLAPVTLELGGKSPCIVTRQADLQLAARRIVWGKFYNAGQSCVAPDYVLAEDSVIEELIEKLKENIRRQFGDDQKSSESFGRIINERHLQRLTRLLDPRKVVFGGEVDARALYVQPTILAPVSWDDDVMQEEIFGPVLPVIRYSDLGSAFAQINSRPKPLSAYLFSISAAEVRRFLDGVSFGGGCINDVVVQFGNPYLSFGGVGSSGMGRYHGYSSFLTFSHPKSIMHRGKTLDLTARYAPYTDGKTRFLRRLFRI